MWFYINEWTCLIKCTNQFNQFSDESPYFVLFRAPQAALIQCATEKSCFSHPCIDLSDKMHHTVIIVCYYYYYY